MTEEPKAAEPGATQDLEIPNGLAQLPYDPERQERERDKVMDS